MNIIRDNALAKFNAIDGQRKAADLLDNFVLIPFDAIRRRDANNLKSAIDKLEKSAPISDVIIILEWALCDLKDKQIIEKYKKENLK